MVYKLDSFLFSPFMWLS